MEEEYHNVRTTDYLPLPSLLSSPISGAIHFFSERWIKKEGNIHEFPPSFQNILSSEGG